MSDPRFARFKTDPRFRRTKKQESKVVVDDRFKGLFDAKKKGKKDKGRVDKYGRPLAEDHETDNLRRFYRLENEDEQQPEVGLGPDYARGAVLLESSDEDDAGHEDDHSDDDESDAGGIIALGRDVSKPIPIPDDETAEIDLDEDAYAELDAQVAAYAKANPDQNEAEGTQRTRRLAVVNLDWDHVRATHLYKIFSSIVSPTAPALASTSALKTTSYVEPKRVRGSETRVARGRVLSVRVYTSEFGKERLAREEREGPPPEVFKKTPVDEEEINERTIFEVGEGEDYDEDLLRKYQLERLRYYYAIVECDTIEAASHIYTELEGTELERSANVLDLSFVPDDMVFDDEYRDEATEELSMPFKALDFTTDALRHSKVKLTWDEDDPERVQMTRRSLSRKEIEENDFQAYLASSTSGSEDEEESGARKGSEANAKSREKLRALLLGGGDELPEGWNKAQDEDDDMDMEVTFTPGLSTAKEDRDETTLEKYQRKMKEKKQKRKAELKEQTTAERGKSKETKAAPKDDFFAGGSEDEDPHEPDSEGEDITSKPKAGKRDKRTKHRAEEGDIVQSKGVPSTAEELALLVASDNAHNEPKHFDMKAVIKAEKKHKRKKRKGKKDAEEENELQEDFNIDVKDDRFKAVHDDHTFAIDPSNPHFKKTKSMSALLEERSKRQKDRQAPSEQSSTENTRTAGENSLKSLVESVKRKSTAIEQRGAGKRRKL